MRQESTHPAFTLVELLVSMTVATLLMTGLATALVIASRAIPDNDSTQRLAGASFQVMEQMTAELATAISFSMLGPQGIEFRVADRNNDSTAEQIRYAWSGVAGAGLTRTYNGDTTTVLENVGAFGLVHGKHDESTTTMQSVETTSAESILAYFDGWSGITPNTQEKTIDLNNWASELVYITPPDDIQKIKFTRAKVWMRRDALTVIGNFTIQLYRPTSVGGYRPSGTPLVTAPAISGIGLPLTAFWATATFDDMPVADLSRSDYLLLVKGTSSDGVWMSHYQHTSAPVNMKILYWTSNGGGTWNPTSNYDRQDMRFYLYGTYISSSQQPITTTIQKLDMVRISLQPGSQAGARMDTDVLILNQPEVTGL